MCYRCDKITEIDLSQFDTSQVTNMRRMFSSCSSLTSLDLSNINTSQVTNMLSIFEECSSLTSLYLSNFNTSKVTDMVHMFSNCSSLISLDLSNFDTTQVSKMVGMFASCSLLTSLNLSNLDTSKVTNMSNMFSYCSNLEYINLNNIEIESSSSINDKIFQDVPENVVICINNTDAKEKIFSKIANLNCSVIDCTNDWKSKQKKIINNTNKCFESYDNSTQYKYEYNGKCVDNCPNGVLYNDSNKCKCELEKCLLCPQVALSLNFCTECNTNYYPKENEPKNKREYFDCY